MKCNIVRKKLIYHLNDGLNSTENEEITTHLANCKNCYHLYTELEATINLTGKQKTLEPNPFLYTKIKQKLDNIEIGKNQTVHTPVYKKVLQPVFLSFLLVLGLYSGIKIGNSFEIKQQESVAVSQSTEFYFDDLQHEKIEILLLNEYPQTND